MDQTLMEIEHRLKWIVKIVKTRNLPPPSS